MQINGIVSVFIGLALTFGTISLVVSAVTEAIATVLALRSKTLATGLGRLLNDPKLEGLALGVLNHGAANPLSSGQAHDRADLTSLPSYIPPQQFAGALIDCINALPRAAGKPAGATLGDSLESIENPQLRTVLLGLYRQSADDVAAFRSNVAGWFDTAMDRLSGDYKRRAQWISFVVALALVVALNIDTWVIAVTLWTQPDLAAHAVFNINPANAGSYTAAFDEWKQSFPFGWTHLPEVGSLPRAIVGWILTAIATLFGAPFWFDTMHRFVQLRGTGPTPAP